MGMAVAISLGLLFAAVEIFIDYQDEITRGRETIEEALYLSRSSAQEAVFQLDQNMG